jgi:hypothetical protein
MTAFAAILLVALVLTVVFGWQYIDSIRDERSTDAYELGWTNGYNVGVKQEAAKHEDAWNAGYDYRKAQESDEKKPVKSAVKKAKKITSKEN